MPKITIEIDDVLPERVQSAISDVQDLLKSYVKKEEPEEVPCLHNDLDYSGDVTSIIDSYVPVYTSEIEAAWFLHGRELEEAYETSGFGENPRERDGRTAIFCYIEQKVNEWYHDNAEALFQQLKGNS